MNFVNFAAFLIFAPEIILQKSNKAIYIKAAKTIAIIKLIRKFPVENMLSEMFFEPKTAILPTRYGSAKVEKTGGEWFVKFETKIKEINAETA